MWNQVTLASTIASQSYNRRCLHRGNTLDSSGMTDMAWWHGGHKQTDTSQKISQRLQNAGPVSELVKISNPLYHQRIAPPSPMKPCNEPNEEIQTAVPSIMREIGRFFLASIDHFSKFPSAEIFYLANAKIFYKILSYYTALCGAFSLTKHVAKSESKLVTFAIRTVLK